MIWILLGFAALNHNLPSFFAARIIYALHGCLLLRRSGAR
jgi:hypothetical protein